MSRTCLNEYKYPKETYTGLFSCITPENFTNYVFLNHKAVLFDKNKKEHDLYGKSFRVLFPTRKSFKNMQNYYKDCGDMPIVVDDEGFLPRNFRVLKFQTKENSSFKKLFESFKRFGARLIHSKEPLLDVLVVFLEHYGEKNNVDLRPEIEEPAEPVQAEAFEEDVINEGVRAGNAMNFEGDEFLREEEKQLEEATVEISIEDEDSHEPQLAEDRGILYEPCLVIYSMKAKEKRISQKVYILM